MTENQIYPIPADFFDNSSNSSNLLKLDIFPNDFIITNSNSNSNNSIIGLTNLTSSSSSILRNHQQQHQQLSALSPQQQYSNTSMDSLRENPMLGSTASIQIPQRSNNSNSNSNSGGGGIISGLLTNSNSNSNSSNILNIKYNNSQPSRIEADFSEYGLDALEAHSYSPNLLHEQLQNHNNHHHNNSQQQHNNQHNNSGLQQLVNTSNNGNTIGGNNNNNQQHNNTITTTTQPISTTTTTAAAVTNGDGDFITIYEIPNSNTNSNTMWSDIGNAMITTKSEPFNMDDDYIFQIDKSDLIQGPTLAELNDETLLEDLIIEDYIHNSNGGNNIGDNDNYLIGSPNSQLHQLQSSSVDSGGSGCGNNSNLHSPENSGSIPPQQLLQQQNHINQQQQQQQFSQQQPHQQHHHHHQQQQQQQQQQNQFQQHGGLHLNLNRNSGGRYNERTNGSSSPYDIYHSTPTKTYNTNAAFSPGSQASSSPLLMNSITPPPPPHSNHRSQFQQNRPNRTALHDLLSKKDYSQSPDRHILGQSVPGPSTSMLMAGTALSPASSSGFGSSSSGRKQISFTSAGGASAAAAAGASGLSRLSSSAPTHLGLEQIWQRREPRQHLLSTGSLVEAESFSSISTGSVLSPEANDFSHDEGYSDYDSDHYEDYSSSDNDDDDTRTTSHTHSNSKNKERYFWQYNVQAKGPKGQRLVIKTQLEDPHVLNEVTDPVFSPNCSVRGIKVYKHSGKARKGDGNDLTPNPRKLHVIGKELDKLGRTINDMIPVSELPFNVRPKSRKEKNKLASRACRLKKKAQHEANKIKLYGLEIEHKKLLNGISDVKRILAIKYQNQIPNQSHSDNADELNNKFDTIAQQSTTVQIAGNSTDFVNKILDKVKAGQPSGGLEDLKSM